MRSPSEQTHPIKKDLLLGLSSYMSSWLRYQLDVNGTVGLQVAIGLNGHVCFAQSYGYANVKRSTLLTNDHLFRIASQSKTFTATAIFLLAQKGAVRLDDTVGHWIPDLSHSDAAEVTLREILGHQSGVTRDGSDCDFWQATRPFPDVSGLKEQVRDGGRVFEINERFKYSNTAYALLGLVIEAATDIPYNRFVTEYVVKPLGLDSTGPDLPHDRQAELVHGHTPRLRHGDDVYPVEHVASRAFSPATGFYSTATDLVRYATAHTMGGPLLTDRSRRLMQRDESTIRNGEREVGRYGLGHVIESIGDIRFVGHSGRYPGQVTRTLIDPASGLTIAVLSNQSGAKSGALAAGIAALINVAVGADRIGDRSSSLPQSHHIGDSRRFTGRFACLWGVMDVAELGGRLFAIDPSALPPEPEALAVDTPDRLRDKASVGFGPVGETWEYVREGGVTVAVRAGGATMLPYERFLSRRAEIYGLGEV